LEVISAPFRKPVSDFYHKAAVLQKVALLLIRLLSATSVRIPAEVISSPQKKAIPK
jgi:hypothetical protein